MEWLRKLEPGGATWTETDPGLKALSAPNLVARTVDAVGPSATLWAIEVAAQAVEQVRDRELVRGFPTVSSGRVRQASEAAFLNLLIAIAAEDGEALDTELSEDLRGVIRLGVRQGLPLDVLLNRVWAIHTVTRDQMLAALSRIVPDEQQAHVLGDIGRAMLDYGNSHAHQVALAYEQEKRSWHGRRSDTQRRTIAAVASGSKPPDHESGLLDVHWSGGHLYALCWVQEQSWIPDVEQAITEFANDVARGIGADRVVILYHAGTAQLWWNAPGPLGQESAVFVERAARPEWLRLALGPQGEAVSGFREAVRGATLTERIARLPEAADREVWRFDDVGHLALLIGDRETAMWFVRRELGALAGPGARMAEIRDTVRLYLVSGNSRVVVAKELHLAPNTVAYRVGQANDLLGRPISERAQQVLLALQIVHALPGFIA